MRKIAKIIEKDRKAFFHNTAAKTGMTDAIIEKDFWVCYMLDYLFHRSQWKFKGGTSLSSGLFGIFRAILRFGSKPSFDEIMHAMAQLEDEINEGSKK